MMQLYKSTNNPIHEENCAYFEQYMARFPWVNFYQPNIASAPWHIQAAIPAKGDDDILIDFWPHKLKAWCSGFGTVEGVDGLREIMSYAIEESNEEPFDLIEAVE